MDDKSVDCVITSPPYNRVRNDTYKFYDDNKTDYFELIDRFTEECLRVCKGYTIINIQQNHFNKHEIFKWVGKYYKNICGVVVWTKNNPQPGNNYHEDDNTRSIGNAFEYIFVLSEDGHDFRAYGKERTYNHISSNVNTEHQEGHGAVMPEKICKWLIQKFTKKGDLILDPFFGTGTTGVCAIDLGRHYVGIEITEEYYKIAQSRIDDFNAQVRMVI